MFDFYPYEQAAEFEEADRKAMADQSTISDVANRVLPDGKKRTFIVTCFPRASSLAQTGRLGTLIINISKYKKTEDALWAAIIQAEEATHAKSRFLANISHELRTPLNAIIGFLNIWMNEVFGPIENKKYTEYAKNINNASLHLVQIIDDILDISRIKA